MRDTLDHLDQLVVEPVGEAGGYGITIGPQASRTELAACWTQPLADPADYISQPCIALSVAPTLVDGRGGAAPRRSSPLAITGAKTWLFPAG